MVSSVPSFSANCCSERGSEREVKGEDEWHEVDGDTTLFSITEMFPVKYIKLSAKAERSMYKSLLTSTESNFREVWTTGFER